ncbi:hypothetical protein BRW64_26780 [Mycolicibacterium diernhoferi]|uniref:Glucose-6-phosphate dehydrogenase n=2 Tax=Mycolicibacterium diernhoferi TaxID=1801 RepID=A0A1Q4H4L4_9MYCO|nr:hypothetical protein BRW64_26780 [Mycolicibacterium diernhoferi]OPE48103.1 hypothetical protein BV510_24185 [Mycolicibacterium diernhoferi]PEG52152.1 glucose-6-phosphate dehydrogenase [Mycolicibacterium diernhoferi]
MEVSMSDLLETDYFGAMLRDCLPAGTLLPRTDFPRLLTDDVRLHVLAGRVAAAEWARAETHAAVAVTVTHVVATEHGLLVAATVSTPTGRRHYLATPHSLFDEIADRMHDAALPAGCVAADCRLDHDLTSMWQFEAALRRMLADYPVLELELSGAQ